MLRLFKKPVIQSQPTNLKVQAVGSDSLQPQNLTRSTGVESRETVSEHLKSGYQNLKSRFSSGLFQRLKPYSDEVLTGGRISGIQHKTMGISIGTRNRPRETILPVIVSRVDGSPTTDESDSLTDHGSRRPSVSFVSGTISPLSSGTSGLSPHDPRLSNLSRLSNEPKPLQIPSRTLRRRKRIKHVTSPSLPPGLCRRIPQKIGLAETQLVHLSLDYPLSFDMAHRLLRMARGKLESVVLTNIYPSGLETGFKSIHRGDKISLDRLTLFTIHASGDVSQLFSRLNLPRLKYLKLGFHVNSQTTLSHEGEPDASRFIFHVPWSRLETLILLNKSPRLVPLRRILASCQNLTRFEWHGGRKKFAMADAALSLEHLKGLREILISSDEGGCDSLLRALLPLKSIEEVEISNFCDYLVRPDRRCLENSTDLSVRIKKSISLRQLNGLLGVWADRLVSGKFYVDDDQGYPNREIGEIGCPKLKYLKIISSGKLHPFWDNLSAPALETLQVILGNMTGPGFPPSEIPVFLRSGREVTILAIQEIIPERALATSSYSYSWRVPV